MRWILVVLAAFVLFGACGEEDLEFPGKAADPTNTPVATSTTTPSTPTPSITPTPTP